MLKELDKIISKHIEEGIVRGVFPGANYALNYKGQVIKGTFGYKALYPVKEKNKLDTIYDIASLTKVVGTTTALLSLIENKELSLKDPISKYLDFIDNNTVTIEDLLTHSSGYPALTPGTEDMVTKEPLIFDLTHCDRIYKTASQVVYSDVGFIYLGWIIDQVTGSYRSYVENIFKSMDMKDTCFNHKEILRIAPTEAFKFRGLIRGFVHDEKSYLLDGVAGHAGLYSTVDDLMKFSQAILDKKLIGETSYLIQEKRMPIDDQYRSIGWIVKTLLGQEIIYHTGYTGTNLLLDFKRNLSFTLLSNRVHPTRKNTRIIQFRRQLEEAIYAFILGEEND